MAGAPDRNRPANPRGGTKVKPKKRGLNYPRAGKTGAARWLPSLRLLTFLVGMGVLVVAVLLAVAYATVPIPDPDDAAQAQTSSVLYADGETTLGEFAAVERESVPLSEVAETVPQAVVASEDRSFYENQGIDPRGIARALWNNLLGRETQGGSTLTQQYVERYFLGTTTTYFGKLREAIIAIKIDQIESKETVLENYLNTIYFGRGSYGIERASHAYFDKPAAELTLSESAVLAAVIPAPSAWDPRVDPERSEERWNRVLDNMLEDGYITEAERDEAAFPETIEYTRSDRFAGPNGYLLEMVREELVTNEGFTEAQLDAGGLEIVTTIDRVKQDAAVAAVDSLPESRPANNRVALVSIDPQTGGIEALYGGADYVTIQRNSATQDRAQGGSTFKPFTLIAALENGFTLEDRFESFTPMEIEGYGGTVKNFDSVNRGRIDLVRATENSVNTVYAQLNIEVGPEKTVDVAVRAGLPEDTSGLEPFPSNVLGPASPHPIDMAHAYATFASGGVEHDPFIVSSVLSSSGALLYTADVRGQREFDQQVIADATYAMTQVVESGTGRTASAIGRPAAGKTGSSQDNKSALFCGFIPQLATCVVMYQVGEDGSEETLTGFGGVNIIAGGTYPTTLWTRYMTTATQGMEVLSFPERSAPTFTPAPTPTTTPTPTPTPTPEPTQEPTGAIVPPVSGLAEDGALAAVRDAGLDPETITEASDQPAGLAIRTEPPAGTSLPEGSKVTVVISRGPDTPDAPGDGAPGDGAPGDGAQGGGAGAAG